MLLPDTRVRMGSAYSFAPSRLIRRGRIALVFAWFAFWLITLLQTCCALWAIPARAVPAHGVVQLNAIGSASFSQHGQSSPCEPSCPESLSPDASLQQATVPAAPTPPASDLPGLPAQPVLVLSITPEPTAAGDGYQSPLQHSNLYHRTSRLLI